MQKLNNKTPVCCSTLGAILGNNKLIVPFDIIEANA